MKKELIGKSIGELQLMMLKLDNSKSLLIQEITGIKNEKNSLVSEIATVNKNIENGNTINNDIEKINVDIISKNTKLKAETIRLDGNIALLYITQQETKQDTINSIENLNKSVLRLEDINKDIDILNKDKISLTDTNIAIIQDNINKNKELHNILNDISKSSNILNDINKDIKKCNTRENKLNEKERLLFIKDSRLTQKETRLNDLKKDLLSKK